mgnify:CR=1 FL=1
MGSDTAIEQLMTTEIETVSSNTEISAAADTLLEQNAGSLVVLDTENHVSGILTCTDLAELVADKTVSAEATVSDYMTTGVVTIAPDKSIQDAAAEMIREGIQHLPVTDSENEMIGMLSTTDVTSHLTYSGSLGTD